MLNCRPLLVIVYGSRSSLKEDCLQDKESIALVRRNSLKHEGFGGNRTQNSNPHLFLFKLERHAKDAFVLDTLIISSCRRTKAFSPSPYSNGMLMSKIPSSNKPGPQLGLSFCLLPRTFSSRHWRSLRASDFSRILWGFVSRRLLC
jgi:hypothetical protein